MSPTGKIHDTGSSDGSNTGTYSAQAYGSGDSCSGTVTYTFTWYSPNPGMPVPTNAILKETSGAGWTESPGSCADGLGDPEIDNNPPTGGGSSGTHYEIKTLNNGSFTKTITASTTAAQVSEVTETVIAAPVLKSISGTTLNDGKLCGLIGYHETAAITAGTYTLGQFSYTISGPDLYKSANGPTSTLHSWNPVEAGDLTQSSVNYAFGAKGNATASATANVIIDGNSIGGVAATANIYDSTPWFYCSCLTNDPGGYESMNDISDPSGDDPVTALSSANFSNVTYPFYERCGFAFFGYVCEAPWQYAVFGQSAFTTSQTLNVFEQWLEPDLLDHSLTGSGNDNNYPYGFLEGDPPYKDVLIVNSDPGVGGDWLTYDTPEVDDLYPPEPGYVNVNDTFEHFLVFNSGTGQDDVPLAGEDWNWVTYNYWTHDTSSTDHYWTLPVTGATWSFYDSSPFAQFVWTSNLMNQHA